MTHTRRDFLRVAGKGVLGGMVLRQMVLPDHIEAMDGAKTNVLFIAVDDLRTELGCYGKSQVISPNIDRLADSGTVFRRAYCQQAVCNSSRASLMTGLRPDTSRVWSLGTHFRDNVPDAVTLPQQFMNHGYHSQGMGKIYHTGHGNRNDKYSWSVPWGTPRISNYLLPESREIIRQNRARAKAMQKEGKKARVVNGPTTECADVADNDYRDGATADRAIATLGEIVDRPFFLAMGMSKPHLPFCAPKRYWDMYDPAKIELADNPYPPKDVPKMAMTNWGEMRKYHGVPAKGPVSEEMARNLVHGYSACVSYIDAQVGRVIGELDRLGLRENTVIALWGDHGWKLGEHGAWCKHTNFELDANAPLIVSAPGLKPGATDALVEFVDIYPSLCDLAGLPTPEAVEGTSFVPLMRDPNLPWKSAAFSQYPRGKVMGYSMRTDRWRYTEWVRRDEGREVVARELYDHVNDPAENVNVAGNAAHAETVKRLAAMMAAGWQGALPPGSSRG